MKRKNRRQVILFGVQFCPTDLCFPQHKTVKASTKGVTRSQQTRQREGPEGLYAFSLFVLVLIRLFIRLTQRHWNFEEKLRNWLSSRRPMKQNKRPRGREKARWVKPLPKLLPLQGPLRRSRRHYISISLHELIVTQVYFWLCRMQPVVGQLLLRVLL